jgi:hypothetical protein
VNGANKTAKLISLGDKQWLIGAHWTAGGRYPKKPKVKQAAKEDLFDPKRTATVWLRESEQIGWFVFDGKPKIARALAPMVLSKLRLDVVPWRGIFKMEGGWWIIAVDDAMAIHPLWDIWVPDADFKKFYEENSARWMTFSSGLQLDTTEESQQWLLGGEDYHNAPKVAAVTGVEQKAKQGAIAVAVLGALAGTGAIGWHLWEKHEAAISHRQLMARLAQQRMNAEQAQQLTQGEINSERKHVEDTWQDWPRPWTSPIAWHTFFKTCAQSWSGRLNRQGWMLTQVHCQWSAKKPGVMDVDRTWARGQFATVLHAPSGAVQVTGDIISQHEVKTLAWAKDAGGREGTALKSLTANRHLWLGEAQKWNGIVEIARGAVTIFHAPIPKNTPASVVKLLHPPVLWKSFPVTFTSIYQPDRWTFWRDVGFVPLSMTVTLGKASQYVVTGVQYGH